MPIDLETGEIITPFLRTPYNYDRDAVSLETALVTPEESLTQQQFVEESDINTIVKRFGITGTLPENPRMPTYGDFTESINDYKTAADMVAQAQSAFMEFPGDLRARFDHDPQRLMEFLDNDKNRDEALQLGLIAKPAEKTRDMVTAIDELSAKFQPANPADTGAKK